MVESFLKMCRLSWRGVLFWYRVLAPARASFLTSLLVCFLFIYVQQGKDILHRLALDPDKSVIPAVWFLFAVGIGGVANWGWAKFLLNCQFPGVPNSSKAENVRRLFRRACGLGPSLGIAFSFLVLASQSGSAKRNYLVLASCTIGMAAILFVFFEFYRYRSRQKPKKRYHSLTDVYADKGTIHAIYFSLGASLALLIAFTLSPVWLGMRLGSAAVTLFAIAAWTNLGSALVYWGHRYRFPTLLFLAVWVICISPLTDNHAIRVIEKKEHNLPSTFENALDKWHSDVSEQYPMSSEADRPLYLVAAAGGGIRAAYWTASLLGELESRGNQQNQGFSAHTFALCGVSGGSLGEVIFAAMRAYEPQCTNYHDRARFLLKDDFLAADLAKMGFADFLQRFLPWPVEYFDRARSLEDAWSSSWPNQELSKTVEDLYLHAAKNRIILPHIFLVGTSVETGQRIITSDLQVQARIWKNGILTEGEFLDIVPTNKLHGKSIRLSTAAHQSARFTYFSPAGRFPDGTRVVDGGYFEVSAAATLMDAVTEVHRHILKRGWKVQPKLILIDNDPVEEHASQKKPYRLLSETLSPLHALYNTRVARGTHAVQYALDYNRPSFETNYSSNVFEFFISKGEVELSLGWTLSARSIQEMDRQLKLPRTQETMSQILMSLPKSNK